MLDWWASGFDLLLSPTCAAPPPPLGHFAPDGDAARGLLRAVPYSAFTGPSLPLHWTDDGLPLGVQLVADTAREDRLLRVAAQLERARPWSVRLPPLHASRR
jgi:amidase